MRPDPHLPEVFLHRQPVDFRKSINGLAVIVEQGMQHSPFSKQLYVFISRVAISPHEASLKTSSLSRSCRSVMNFAKLLP